MSTPSAEKIYKHINYFTSIYDVEGNEVNPIPENVKVTVFCDSGSERGFIYDEYKDKLGFEALIAKKWIFQNDLKDLLNPSTKQH